MSREYFIAYHDYLESMSELSDAECGRLFRAALEYSSEKKAIELRGNERFLFGFIKAQIDRDNKKYAEKCDQNRNNGRLGGRPKTESDGKPNGSENNQTVSEKSERFFKNLKEDKDKEEDKNKDKDKDKDKDSSLLTTFVMNSDKKKLYGEFKNVFLTGKEYDRLKLEYTDDLAGIIEYLSSYIEMKGYKAKSHYLAIRKWVALAFHEQKAREQKLKKGSACEDNEPSYDLEEYENQMKGDDYAACLNSFLDNKK